MDTSPEKMTIEFDQQTLNSLNTTRKWAMFLAIIGFIFVGILIIFGIITGAFISVFNTGDKAIGTTDLLIVILFLLIAIAYFLHVLFLFRFSKHTAKVVQTLDKNEFSKTIKNLKFSLAFLGALIIFALLLYIGLLIVSGSSIEFLKEL
jgi:hypothetical protein